MSILSPTLFTIETSRRCRSATGFTLIELLVSLSLLAVIMAGLLAALRTMGQTEVKIDRRLQRLDEARLARHFLEQTLGRVSAQTLPSKQASGKNITSFEATPTTLTWLGIMPARPDVGGRHFFRLALDDHASGKSLTLQFLPWEPGMSEPDWAKADQRTLATDIQTFSIQAQGLPPGPRATADPWPNGWQEGWPIADTLPEQVRIRLSDAGGPWPDWTVALHQLPQSSSGFAGPSIGGGVR